MDSREKIVSMHYDNGYQINTTKQKKVRSTLTIDGPTPIIIFCGIRYSWLRKIMWRLCFGITLEKVKKEEE